MAFQKMYEEAKEYPLPALCRQACRKLLDYLLLAYFLIPRKEKTDKMNSVSEMLPDHEAWWVECLRYLRTPVPTPE